MTGDGDSAPALAFGVDVGGTKVLALAVEPDGRVVADARVATPRRAIESGAVDAGMPGSAAAREDVADALADVVRRLERSTGSEPGTVPVGIGVAGMLDHSGVLRFAPNLPGAAGADLRRLLAQRVDVPSVRLDNDANCAALAELRLGAARGARDALVVTLGTGIGGALVRDGRVHTGMHGFAGEVGHMVVDPSGPPCPCTGRGCWERFASGAGLGRLAREAAFAGRLSHVVSQVGGDPEAVRGEDVTAAAERGDPGALGVMEELGWWIALGLSNLTAVLDPERIVVGGGLAEVRDVLLVPTRRAFAQLVEGGSTRPEISIVAAELGERAGAIGAGLLALEAPAG